MILDCAGLDSSSEQSSELDSAGPGELVPSPRGAAWMSGDFVTSEAMGSEESLCLALWSRALLGNDVVCRGEAVEPPSWRIVLSDVCRFMSGRTGNVVVVAGVPLALASCRGMGESRLVDRAEPVRGWADAAGSEPDTGEGATDPLAAAVAFRTWART